MSAKIISGTEVAKAIREELKTEVAELKDKHGVVPGLVTILVGEDPASQSYVSAKNKTAHALGIHSEQVTLPADTSEQDLLATVDKYNKDKNIHGILELLTRSGVETSGAEVVVIGRSNIVGKPIANLMLQKRKAGNATITLCHTRTKDMAAHCKRADIIIAAVGVPKMVTADMVKDGVVIIDVGVNRIGKTADGKAILAGDVDFDAVKEKASYITPVPGGVGPMTITMLMKNTVQAARQIAGVK